MNKLTIKELAPYLPYGLKVQHTTFLEFGKNRVVIDTLDSLCADCATFESSMDYYLIDPEDNECEIKPILRPLSDLTKSIEHNGEKFVPQDILNHLDLEWVITSDNLVMKMNYEDVLKLLEWHFDIFGLIEKGLAIDINTLKNEN
jgi:hypothetical protein